MEGSPDPLLAKVEAFIRRHRLTPTAFGRLAAKDPGFVFDLRDGRECRRATRQKVLTFMADYREEALA